MSAPKTCPSTANSDIIDGLPMQPCGEPMPCKYHSAAPTTAAPAELPNRREFHASTPAEFAAAAKVAQGGDTIIVPDWPLPRAAAPAEQLSGKAADPRPVTTQSMMREFNRLPDAQPQAPVKQWRSPNLGLTIRQVLLEAASSMTATDGLSDDLHAAYAYIREHPPEVAAPLREERDKLAGKVRVLEGDIAALNSECVESQKREREAEEHAQAAIKIRAALGAPEGQPPAPPQELLGKEGAGAAPPRKAPQEGPMAHFAALADQDCEHGMEAIGETCSAESASREEGNEEDYPFQYWCGPCIAKAVGFKPSPVRIQRARVLAESAPSSPEEQLSGKELK